jgi:hypothetical protein
MTKRILAIGVCLVLGGLPEGLAQTPGGEEPPSSAANSNPRLLIPVAGCPVCDLWREYEDIILQAKQEVGPLPDGVLYFYYAADPAVIEPLIRFAHERDKLADRLARDPELRDQLGERCFHRRLAGTVTMEISTSARGIFAILTATDPGMFGWLRDKARMATRQKVPFWF